MYSNLSIPPELKKFIPFENAKRVEFVEILHELFVKMLEAFYGTTEITTTRFKHENLAKEISRYAITQKVTRQANFIKSTTIIEYYTGSPASKRKQQLILIYNYLDIELKKRNPEKGGEWFLNLIENPPEPEIESTPVADHSPLKKIKGAKEITRSFLQNIVREKHFKATDFYLSKDNDNCQWYGVMQEWDQSRDIQYKLWDSVTTGFDKELNDDFLNVIIGKAGVGKSTVLRRLCVEIVFKTNVFCLWIEDLKKFYDDIESFEINESCILVIHDWERITNIEIENKFLHYVSNKTKLKLIVGDQSYKNRSYNVYRHANRTSQISTIDNAAIIEKIILVDERIRSSFNRTISKQALKKAPIYIILFILIRTSATNDPKLLEKSNTLLGKFHLIVQNDIEQLMLLNYNLANLICAWAFIYTMTGLETTWESLLKIAESSHLQSIIEFDTENSFCEILSNYISLEPFVYPIERGKHLMRFNHDLLADEGLSLPYSETGDKQEKVNMMLMGFVDRFAQLKQWRPIATIINIAHADNEGIKWISTLPKQVAGFSPMPHLLYVSNHLQFIYDQTLTVQNEQLWERYLIDIMINLVYFNKDYSLKLVLSELVALGCTAICVKTALDNVANKLFIADYLLELVEKEAISVEVDSESRGLHLKVVKGRNGVSLATIRDL